MDNDQFGGAGRNACRWMSGGAVMQRSAILTVVGVMFCVVMGCGTSDSPAPQNQSTPSPERMAAAERMAALPPPEKAKKREPTLAYWKAFIEIVKDEDKKVGKNSSADDITQSYKRAVERFAELPVLNVDEELVSLINECSKDFLDLAAANDEAVKHNAKVNYLENVGNEIAHSLATGKPGTYYREFNKEAKQGRDKMEAIKQRLRDNLADLLKMRATLTQRYEVEFPLLETQVTLSGDWSGTAPDGTDVSYSFSTEGTMIWRVNEKEFVRAFPEGLNAKYRVRGGKPPHEIDIYDFNDTRLKEIRFRGILEFTDGHTFKLQGKPSNQGERPKEFSKEAVVFRARRK
jgi:hypothetical protein